MADRPRTSAGRDRTRDSGPWWSSRWALAVLLALLALIFVFENREPVAIRLLIPLVVMPQWAALTGVLAVGVLIGVLVRRGR